MLLEIAVTVFFILVLTLGLVVYARWNYTKLDGVGFPVMKPSLLLGSAPDIHTRIPHFDDIARHKVYGPVWGVNIQFEVAYKFFYSLLTCRITKF